MEHKHICPYCDRVMSEREHREQGACNDCLPFADRSRHGRPNVRSYMSTTYPRLTARPLRADVEAELADPVFLAALDVYVDAENTR